MRGRIDRRRLVLGGAASALAGCAAAPDRLAEDRRRPAEGGIGGTGIVGVVTALGSVVVAGQRVALGPDTMVTDAFGARRPADLLPGHSLTIEAAAGPDGLIARRVHITEPVIGPVEAVEADGRGLRVAGVAVRLEPGVRAAAHAGMRVAVSGLWDGTRVVASRIERRAPDGPVALAGTVAPGGRVAGVAIAPGAAQLPPAGRFVTVTGRLSGTGLDARRIAAGRFTAAAGPLVRLIVEGYLEPAAAPPGYRLSGLGHSFDAGARLDPLAGGRALFVGPYSGSFAVAHGLALPEGLAARRATLPAGAGIAARPDTVSTR